MPIENCGCGGNNIDRFYSLFTCDHANCAECHWTNNKCCLGCYVDTSCTTGDCSSGCINYYDIPMQDVITSKIKSFGFCMTNKDEETGIITGALAVQFIDGTKKLFLNVNKEIYDALVNANKDYMFINLSQSVCNKENQCVTIP